jgi:valyl-tRNA synthetase
VAALEQEGLLVKVDDHAHSVGHCYRCKTIIEPNLSLQWFVSTKPLAEKAIKAVEEGKTRIIPDHWTKTYYEWMNNIRDWCISRQIWWGHRIPVWTCADCGEIIVELEDPTACPACGKTNLTQDTDVLDTWFSSALWPFSTMGWPDDTDLLKTFYPTATLVTGFDILFFWVARMMMMGIHFMDEVPFKDVYIHALVRDEDGQKMSKSKGNVIDPLTVIDTYGTDAFRFTLTAFAAQGRDIKLSLARVEGYRHFINKLWNAARFSFMHLDKAYPDLDPAHMGLADHWILSRLKKVTEEVTQTLDEYRFNETAAALYKFVWNEFCDWYLEASKPALYGKNGDACMTASKAVLYRVLRDTLVLLHPLVPFVTEEIWSRIPGAGGSIMTAVYPGDRDDLVIDDTAEKDMDLVMGVISGIRNIRGEMNIAPSLNLSVQFQSDDPLVRETATTHKDLIMILSRLDAFDITPVGEKPKSSATAIVGEASVFVNLKGVIDFDKEAARLEKAVAKLEKEVEGIAKKLDNPGFVGKAPEDVVEKVRAQHREAREKLDKYLENLNKIKTMA